MEYLEGQPLNRVQARARQRDAQKPDAKPAFPLDMQLFVLCQVLEGLEYAHALCDYDGTELNIVHRDVSPQNVFVTYGGHTKLVDFGIAKSLETSKTRAGVVKGKIAYMSPEQVLATRLDHRSDLFSVGVLLWEAIAGRDMHQDTSVYATLHRLARGELPELRALVPNVSPELESIVKRALEVKPENRFQNAASFRTALCAYLDTRPKVSARDVGAMVSALFANERAEMTERIRLALSGSSVPPPAPEVQRSTRRLLTHAQAQPEPLTQLALPEAATQPHVPALIALEASSARKRRRLHAALLTAFLVGSSGAAAAWFRFSASHADAIEAQHTEPVEPRAPQPGAVRGNVLLEVAVTPANAQLTLDGQPLGDNPYRREHAREASDSALHTLEATAPGYAPWRRELRFDRDLMLEAQLAPRIQHASAVPPAAAEPTPPSRPPAEAPTRAAKQPKARDVERAPKDDDPFDEFPTLRKRQGSGPLPLDRGDPWDAR